MSPNSPHLFLSAVPTSHSDRSELLCLWPSDCLTDCVRGCWMCGPTRLTWHCLCRGAAHFRDLTLLLLLFSVLQCMLLGAGCFLCGLRSLHWSRSVRTYFGLSSPPCKSRNNKRFFMQTPASRCRQQSPTKSNNKLCWIPSVHMWLSTSPWCAQCIFEWKATPLPLVLLLFSEVSLWMFHSNHTIIWLRAGGPAQTCDPSSRLRAGFAKGPACPPYPHVTAIAGPLSRCSGSGALSKPEHIDSYRHSNSLLTLLLLLTPDTCHRSPPVHRPSPAVHF